MKITFKSDTKKRKRYFTPEHFAHPAKMHLGLALWIIGKYTEPGDLILDPMAGAGTTMVACTLGRNIALVDLEEKFVTMMQDNWGKVKEMPHPNYPVGGCQIIQGDARNLEGLLVDKCIFSPPYAESLAGSGKDSVQWWNDKAGGKGFLSKDYSENPSNIGNLPYGSIDKIVTSPPYEGSISGISEQGREREKEWCRQQGINPDTNSCIVIPSEYSGDKENIGNLKSASYLEAMLQVYQQCYEVLKPNGLMILVTKDFIRNRERVLLSIDTLKLCEQAGFVFEDWHERVLTQQSFWRVIYHKKYPEVEKIDTEDILVFRKPSGTGQVDAVISSPPYEEAMGKKHHSPVADRIAREKRLPQSYTGRGK